MIEIKKNETKDISLKIKTIVIDPEAVDMGEDELLALLKRMADGENVEKEVADIMDEESQSEIELCTEATLSEKEDGCIEISYLENEDDEQLKTRSKIIFSKENPSLVIMSKEGAMSAFLSFEEGKTHICTYDTPFMPIKVYVNASVVDNRLLSDGTLRLNYILNLNDCAPQHFAVEVKIKEEPEDILKELFS
jgi:uncharacterized beta-barrel protein YwiB (DUF1934 family)